MLAATARLARWRGRWLLLTALAMLATGVSARAALAAPTWGIKMTHANLWGAQVSACPGKVAKSEPEPCGIDPLTEGKGDEGEGGNGETFARESGSDTYTITVSNTGTELAKPLEEEVTVTDQLPAGMLVGATGSDSLKVVSGGQWSCTLLPGLTGTPGAYSAFKCSTSEAPEIGKPGELVYKPIIARVDVGRQAANPSTNVATVSGGGAPEASTTPAEGKTTVTEAVPFGIEAFSTNIVESLGNPFRQAGGHPFAVSNEIVVNYTADNENKLVPAGDAVKELAVEVPRGFIGNPQITPARCRVVGQCAANTVVGYTSVILSGSGEGAKVEGGKSRVFEAVNLVSSSLIWNMAPVAGSAAVPGSPAEFGFLVDHDVPFRLAARVRSNGDYGVTVGDSAVGEKVLGVRATFCEYGATLKAGVPPSFSCNAAAATQPFLTNPTECSSPLAWTVQANPWREPTDYQPKTVETPRLEGCNLVQFQPETGIEFTPSEGVEGGTTQADEPTGMTLNLKVPQTNEAERQRDARPQERHDDAAGGDDGLAIGG